jgi:hypothetical protein
MIIDLSCLEYDIMKNKYIGLLLRNSGVLDEDQGADIVGIKRQYALDMTEAL